MVVEDEAIDNRNASLSLIAVIVVGGYLLNLGSSIEVI
jgi:hypothetical protein